jgi:hypothetical protein
VRSPCCGVLVKARAAARARTRSRMASWVASGTYTGVSSPGPVQRRQGRGVTAVRLYPVPGRRGIRAGATTTQSQRRSVSCRCRPVTARAGLVTHPELLAAPPRAFDQPADHLGPVLHASQMPHLAIATARRDRHCDRRLVDIQPHERDRLHQARLLCLRPCAGQSGATLDMGIR